MTLLGTWNGETPWRIYRTGDPIRRGGDGVTWRCTCPHGEPQGSKELNKLWGYPCRQLQSIWHYAEHGLYDPHVNWTPEGIEAGKRCRCRSGKPCPLRFGPPLQRPPDQPPLGAALNKPCPCGSGRKFKKCEGFGPNRPDGPAHPLLRPLELAQPSAAPPPCPVPLPLPERRRRARAEGRAQREEAAEEVRRRVDVVINRDLLRDEARRERVRAGRAKTEEVRVAHLARSASLRALVRSGDVPAIAAEAARLRA